jgi:hypothetical protein
MNDQAAAGSVRVLAAEFIGTFALIFIGAGAALALGVNHDPPVAFAHGLTIMVLLRRSPISAASISIRPSASALQLRGCFQPVAWGRTSSPSLRVASPPPGCFSWRMAGP